MATIANLLYICIFNKCILIGFIIFFKFFQVFSWILINFHFINFFVKISTIISRYILIYDISIKSNDHFIHDYQYFHPYSWDIFFYRSECPRDIGFLGLSPSMDGRIGSSSLWDPRQLHYFISQIHSKGALSSTHRPPSNV